MRIKAIITSALALVFSLWFYANAYGTQKAIVFNTPRHISEFKLIGDNQKPFTNKNLKGHWSFVFFGFTQCPQLCPTTLSVLNKTYKALQKARVKSMPQVVFISIDPERDNPKVIKNYLISFNKNFVGATGTKKQLAKLTREFSVVYMQIARRNGQQGKYDIEHSGAILLTDPQGKLYSIFTMPHNPATIASDFKFLETNYSKQKG